LPRELQSIGDNDVRYAVFFLLVHDII